MLQTGLRHIFKATQLHKKKKELKEYILNPENGFTHVPVLLANVFEQLMKVKLPDCGQGKEIDICVAIEQMIQDGVEEGKILGIKKGKTLGL